MTSLQYAILYSILLAIVIVLCCWIMSKLEKIADMHLNRLYIPYCIIVWIIFSVYVISLQL